MLAFLEAIGCETAASDNEAQTKVSENNCNIENRDRDNNVRRNFTPNALRDPADPRGWPLRRRRKKLRLE